MAAGRGSARRGHGASSLRREIAGAVEEGADFTRLEGAAGGGRRVRPQRPKGQVGWPYGMEVGFGLRNLGFSRSAKANQLK